MKASGALMDDVTLLSRRAMLDVLSSVGAHRDSVILVGAHAIYLQIDDLLEVHGLLNSFCQNSVQPASVVSCGTASHKREQPACLGFGVNDRVYATGRSASQLRPRPYCLDGSICNKSQGQMG